MNLSDILEHFTLECTDCDTALEYEGEDDDGILMVCRHCTPPFGSYLRLRPR